MEQVTAVFAEAIAIPQRDSDSDSPSTTVGLAEPFRHRLAHLARFDVLQPSENAYNYKTGKSAALIGLAISVGASTLLLPQQGSNARATEPVRRSLAKLQPYRSQVTTADSQVNSSASVQAIEPTVPLRENGQMSETESVESEDWTEPSEILQSQPPQTISQTDSDSQYPNDITNPLTVMSVDKTVNSNRLNISAKEILYRVQPGDTLWAIASDYRVSVTELLQANYLTEAASLEVNQILIVPESPSVPSSSVRTKEAIRVLKKGSNATIESTPSSSTQYAQIPASQLEPTGSAYIENLRADISRLRQKYRQQSHSSRVHIPSAVVTPAVSTVTSRSANLSKPVEKSESESRFEQHVETLQADIQRMRQQHRAKLSHRQTSDWETVGAPPASPSPHIATAPLGSENYEPLINIPTISPELPPLNAPDTYLPDTTIAVKGYIWPALGELTSGYGWRWGRMHKGIDIAGPTGTPIVAAASGVVIYAGWNEGGYGNLVEIQHPDGSMTRYAHNDRIRVREGQQVERGQQIAEMGSTGFSTGPHLHFEIHRPGQGAQNPIAYLPPA